MQVKPFFLNRIFLFLHVQTGLRGPVERVGYERGDRAEGERREIENTRGQDLVGPGQPGVQAGVQQRADLEALVEAVPPLVEFGRWLFLGPGSDRGDGVLGRVGFGVGGSGEHLDDLFEGEGVGLYEGGRVRAVGLGSGDGFGCGGGLWWWWWVEPIAAGAAAGCAGGAVAVGRWVSVFLEFGRGFH